jgi:monofunctional biosynthetic peptidoglycan transglycosylase
MTISHNRILLALAFVFFVRFPMNDPQTLAVEQKSVAGPERVLFDFSDPAVAKQWKTVNDNVMGGVSKGEFKIEDSKLIFYGDLSLKNRGGFTSVQARKTKLGLADATGVQIRFKGDGRSYYLTLYAPTLMMAHSYRAEFQTKADEWMEVTVPFDQFESTAFGQRLPLARAINPKRLDSVGFMLFDKKAGPFRLEIDWIKAVEK